MLNVTGIIALPSEPKVSVVKPENNSGFFINFTAVSQGKTEDYHYWECSVWLPNQETVTKWQEDYLVSGNVLYIESATLLSTPVLDGKYHHTKIKLDHYKTKKLVKALWAQE
jgi:hypothetical protein